jgi:nitric oxide reductase activation protein
MDQEGEAPSGTAGDEAGEQARQGGRRVLDESGRRDDRFDSHDDPGGLDPRGEERAAGSPHGGTFIYDEWDGTIGDYRSGWCRLIERIPPSGDSDFAEATMATYAPIAKTLRRYFEGLRPSGLRRMFAQIDGEELDLDATIRRIADRRAGAAGSDRIYLHRDKRDRSVAAAFLVDLSGSTSRQISGGRRIIDVEKESLILLSEALDAIGDQYAIFGYSGQARRHVDFVILKDFGEPAVRSAARIGALAPLQQNRDGTAIRHAVRKLLVPESKARLLILISDGRPLDESYADEYALEDTKRALQEARRRGVHTFCITVDRDADDYLRRMYGDVHYLVIDDVAALPARLPRIYQRLTA